MYRYSLYQVIQSSNSVRRVLVIRHTTYIFPTMEAAAQAGRAIWSNWRTAGAQGEPCLIVARDPGSWAAWQAAGCPQCEYEVNANATDYQPEPIPMPPTAAPIQPAVPRWLAFLTMLSPRRLNH